MKRLRTGNGKPTAQDADLRAFHHFIETSRFSSWKVCAANSLVVAVSLEAAAVDK